VATGHVVGQRLHQLFKRAEAHFEWIFFIIFGKLFILDFFLQIIRFLIQKLFISDFSMKKEIKYILKFLLFIDKSPYFNSLISTTRFYSKPGKPVILKS
jgi:hypothetical protein